MERDRKASSRSVDSVLEAIWAVFAIVAALFARGAVAVWAEPAPEPGLHKWEYVTYPDVVTRGAKAEVGFVIGYGDKREGLRLDIRSHGGEQAPLFFGQGKISGQILRENGKVEAAMKNSFGGSAGVGKAGFLQWVVIGYFPWDENQLDAAWIEVSLAQQRFLLELPYGFSRDPSLATAPSKSYGRPKLPLAAQHAAASAQVVYWESVHYEFGEIRNDWRLALIQSNPFDAKSEVVLYRDDSAVGKSMFLWDLHSPRTTLRIIDEDGGVVASRCMNIRLHEDGMRRSDSFALFRNGDARRSWGQIEVSVDENSYRLVVPSSVFRYIHGRSEPER
jgi:hypothetical protein